MTFGLSDGGLDWVIGECFIIERRGRLFGNGLGVRRGGVRELRIGRETAGASTVRRYSGLLV
jgi:hypothetical protein